MLVMNVISELGLVSALLLSQSQEVWHHLEFTRIKGRTRNTHDILGGNEQRKLTSSADTSPYQFQL